MEELKKEIEMYLRWDRETIENNYKDIGKYEVRIKKYKQLLIELGIKPKIEKYLRQSIENYNAHIENEKDSIIDKEKVVKEYEEMLKELE